MTTMLSLNPQVESFLSFDDHDRSHNNQMSKSKIENDLFKYPVIED